MLNLCILASFASIFCSFYSTLELSIDETILLTSFPAARSSTRGFPVVEIVFYIEIGPSWFRPKMLDALGLGKERLIFRFSLFLMFDA